MKDYFKKTKFEPDITHGVCPMCDMPTMLVSLTKDHYRCITCGSDLEQKINIASEVLGEELKSWI